MHKLGQADAYATAVHTSVDHSHSGCWSQLVATRNSQSSSYQHLSLKNDANWVSSPLRSEHQLSHLLRCGSHSGKEANFNLNTVYFGIIPRETGWRFYGCLAQPIRSLFESNRSVTYFHCQYKLGLSFLKKTFNVHHLELG